MMTDFQKNTCLKIKQPWFTPPEPCKKTTVQGSWTELNQSSATRINAHFFGSGHLDQAELGLVQRSTHLIGWTTLNRDRGLCGQLGYPKRWMGQSVGVRQPEPGEVQLSKDEIEHGLKFGLFQKDAT